MFSSGIFSASCGRGTLFPLTVVSQELKMLMTGLVGLLPVDVSARGASVVGSTFVAITSVRLGACTEPAPWSPAAPGWPPGAAGAHAAATNVTIATIANHRPRINVSLP